MIDGTHDLERGAQVADQRRCARMLDHERYAMRSRDLGGLAKIVDDLCVVVLGMSLARRGRDDEPIAGDRRVELDLPLEVLDGLHAPRAGLVEKQLVAR